MPDRIIRKRLKKKLDTDVKREYYYVEHIVYSQAEADKADIEYVPWRDARDGQWALTDDGYVVECIYRRVCGKKANNSTSGHYYEFSIGQSFETSSARLLYLPRKETGNFHSISGKRWQDSKYRKYRNRDFAKAYVYQMLAGEPDYAKLGKIARPSSTKPVVQTKFLLNQEWMQEMIDTELEKILKKKGISEETVLDMIMKGASIAENKEDAANYLRATENLVDILGMKQKKQKPQGMEVEAVQLEEIQEAVQLEEKKPPVLPEKNCSLQEREGVSA